MRRLQSTSSETPTSIFFGSQPRNWQVPPNGRESTTATFQPASRVLYAADWAADPVPITITSTVVAMVLPRFDSTIGPNSSAGLEQQPEGCSAGLFRQVIHSGRLLGHLSVAFGSPFVGERHLLHARSPTSNASATGSRLMPLRSDAQRSAESREAKFRTYSQKLAITSESK